MYRNTVGGFQGAVIVLTPEGVEVARAACRYRAEVDRYGTDRWSGRLHRITPPGVVDAGTYRLQFPEGEQGEITIEAVSLDSEIVHFVGTGSRPLFPVQPRPA